MPEKPKETYLDLRQGGNEQQQLDSEVQRAQEQLLVLKRQQDVIERQKRDLEELSRRQSEFEQGKSEMIEKLTRTLGSVERESMEAQRRHEQLLATRQAFLEHLAVLESIDPKGWDKPNLSKELNRALGAVDDARNDFSKLRVRIRSEAPADSAEEAEGDGGFAPAEGASFAYWFKCGFAFTLPFIVFAFLAMVVLIAILRLP